MIKYFRTVKNRKTITGQIVLMLLLLFSTAIAATSDFDNDLDVDGQDLAELSVQVDTGTSGEPEISSFASLFGSTGLVPVDLSDPVTTAMTGSNRTFNVGPGQEYEEPDTVPWGALTAGDVVNIFHRSEPYRWKFALRGQGTETAPIVVNGVTDASGNRPRFELNGARTCSGCNPGEGNDIFNTSSAWSLEDYGGIVVRPGVSDSHPHKPCWIIIKNLELHGAGNGATFTNLLGEDTQYREAAAGIWIQPSRDILLENNVIYDNGFGVFTMAKNNTLDYACERIVMRSNRAYLNGVVGSYNEHNVYMQCANPVVEGNYFGVLRDGAPGSSYKSRSSGEIFRYNYVEASSRAIDWVYSEEQNQGILAQPDYGTDYAYGNIIVNDCSLGRCAGSPIHYGGDNEGEQGNVETLFVPTTPYRSHLYFYNNTVFMRINGSERWRVSVFDLSERSTRVDAWNNIFYLGADAQYQWVSEAGNVNLLGNNLVYGTVRDSDERALEINYSINETGTLLTGDPDFTDPDNFDLRLGPDSAAIGHSTGVPTGISPDEYYMDVPVNMQTVSGANGLEERTASDLGALEAE